MNIISYTDETLFDTLKPQWNDLVQRSTTNNPFALWEWHVAWWQSFCPGQLWVLTIEDNGHLLGIAPFFIEHHPEQGRVVRLIGHIDVTDYMDLIVDNGRRQDVYVALADYLQANADQFNALGLANIRESEPTYTEFADVLRAHGFDVSFELNEVAPMIPLPSSYDDYLKSLNSRERKEVKRKMRHANGGIYDMQWYILDETHNLDEHIDTFLSLMALAEQEKADFLQNPKHVEFFKRLIHQMQPTGHLYLSFMTIDGVPAATYFGFDYNQRIYLYNSGLDPDKFGSLSPGIVLLQFMIEDFIQRDFTVFDFLRGNESYKYKMGASDTHLYQLNATKIS